MKTLTKNGCSFTSDGLTKPSMQHRVVYGIFRVTDER